MTEGEDQENRKHGAGSEAERVGQGTHRGADSAAQEQPAYLRVFE